MGEREGKPGREERRDGMCVEKGVSRRGGAEEGKRGRDEGEVFGERLRCA